MLLVKINLMKLLNKQKIDYVLYHLNLFINLDELKSHFKFISHNEIGENTFFGAIIFPLSSKSLNRDSVFFVDNIPVLFPNSTKKRFYYFENNNLIFEHDILKSAFYLLSGYQEYESKQKDSLGRFPYNNSIQKYLGIVQKPIVNYYFEIIADAIEEFCSRNNIEFKRKKLFDNFGFMLTHDIDKVDTYNIYDFVYKFKQIFKLVKFNEPYKRVLKSNLKYIVNYLNIFSKRNPFWNFFYLQELEKKHKFKSVFYFLHKDILHSDSYYTFNENRIKNLINKLIVNGNEIGIHGTIKSSYDENAMLENINKLKEVSLQKIAGVRQHRLMFEMPKTICIHEKVGLKYDTTLGFAEHDGFRNSYCLPFKLYDFENDRMIDVWEMPLNVMDGTLFSYRKLNSEDAFNSVKKVINEVKKFNGIFTLLWHNSFFDNDLYPDITLFYENLLRYIRYENPQNVLGKDIVKLL